MIFDYCPDIFKNPKPIDVDEFAFNYMGLKQDFNYLSNSGFIWGRMVFNDTAKIPIYVPETKEADYMPAEKGTIIIENLIMGDRRDYRYRSTVIHECGHWIYHQQLFMREYKRANRSSEKAQFATLCRDTDIGFNKKNAKVLMTDLDWIEHHAKYLSGAILMPKSLVIKICSDIEKGINLSDYFYSFKVTYMAKKISEIFNVSIDSAKVRIQQLRLGHYKVKNTNSCIS
jgi:Zn-dependent peptidase ImmA (M78 family)